MQFENTAENGKRKEIGERAVWPHLGGHPESTKRGCSHGRVTVEIQDI